MSFGQEFLGETFIQSNVFSNKKELFKLNLFEGFTFFKSN